MKITKKTKKLFVQIGEYLVAGGAYFWSGYFIIVLLTPVIGLWWANLIGNGVGITVNFILERYWVFDSKKKRSITQVSYRYIVLTGVNLFLNYLILKGLQDIGINVAIGQFIAAGFFTIWNFIWYRLWVFKGTSQSKRIRHHA